MPQHRQKQNEIKRDGLWPPHFFTKSLSFAKARFWLPRRCDRTNTETAYASACLVGGLARRSPQLVSPEVAIALVYPRLGQLQGAHHNHTVHIRKGPYAQNPAPKPRGLHNTSGAARPKTGTETARFAQYIWGHMPKGLFSMAEKNGNGGKGHEE